MLFHLIYGRIARTGEAAVATLQPTTMGYFPTMEHLPLPHTHTYSDLSSFGVSRCRPTKAGKTDCIPTCKLPGGELELVHPRVLAVGHHEAVLALGQRHAVRHPHGPLLKHVVPQVGPLRRELCHARRAVAVADVDPPVLAHRHLPPNTIIARGAFQVWGRGVCGGGGGLM